MQVEVTFSMLEIYSEIVRDLLNSKGDKKTGLQVREDPKNGFYRMNPISIDKMDFHLPNIEPYLCIFSGRID